MIQIDPNPELHEREIATRNVHADDLAAWEALNDEMLRIDGILFPPPWAYEPYGMLKETPCFPGTPGYVPPTPAETKELLILIQHDLKAQEKHSARTLWF